MLFLWYTEVAEIYATSVIPSCAKVWKSFIFLIWFILFLKECSCLFHYFVSSPDILNGGTGMETICFRIYFFKLSLSHSVNLSHFSPPLSAIGLRNLFSCTISQSLSQSWLVSLILSVSQTWLVRKTWSVS